MKTTTMTTPMTWPGLHVAALPEYRRSTSCAGLRSGGVTAPAGDRRATGRSIDEPPHETAPTSPSATARRRSHERQTSAVTPGVPSQLQLLERTTPAAPAPKPLHRLPGLPEEPVQGRQSCECHRSSTRERHRYPAKPPRSRVDVALRARPTAPQRGGVSLFPPSRWIPRLGSAEPRRTTLLAWTADAAAPRPKVPPCLQQTPK